MWRIFRRSESKTVASCAKQLLICERQTINCCCQRATSFPPPENGSGSLDIRQAELLVFRGGWPEADRFSIDLARECTVEVFSSTSIRNARICERSSSFSAFEVLVTWAIYPSNVVHMAWKLVAASWRSCRMSSNAVGSWLRPVAAVSTRRGKFFLNSSARVRPQVTWVSAVFPSVFIVLVTGSRQWFRVVVVVVLVEGSGISVLVFVTRRGFEVLLSCEYSR